jgi:hypothetical protein
MLGFDEKGKDDEVCNDQLISLCCPVLEWLQDHFRAKAYVESNANIIWCCNRETGFTAISIQATVFLRRGLKRSNRIDIPHWFRHIDQGFRLRKVRKETKR